MLIRQKERHHRLEVNEKLSAANLDLNILKGIHSSKIDLLQKKNGNKQAMSINDLSKILKQKNKKLQTISKHEKLEAREWLKDQGVNYKKLIDQVKDNTRVVANSQAIKRQQMPDQSSIFMSTFRANQIKPQQKETFGFTQQTRAMFIRRHNNRAISTVIMKNNRNNDIIAEKKNSKIRKSLITKMKGIQNNKSYNLKNSFDRTREGGMGVGVDAYSYAQDQLNQPRKSQKSQYYQLVQNLSRHGFKNSLQLLKQIKSFWKIVYHHIITIQHYSPQLNSRLGNDDNNDQKAATMMMNTYLMFKSLILVEKQYDRMLPKVHNCDYQRLQQKIKQMENISAQQLPINVVRNSSGKSLWGTAFLLFRAGQTDQFIRVLEIINAEQQNQQQSPSQSSFTQFATTLYQDFSRYIESVHAQNPKASIKAYKPIDDDFYNQLIYILKGTPKIVHSINQYNDLDFTWIILRTLGLYRIGQQVQRQYRDLLKKYIQSMHETSADPTEPEKLMSYFYLGAYKQILSLGEVLKSSNSLTRNKNFNQDDFFHLTMTVYYYQELWGNTTNQVHEQAAYLTGVFNRALSRYMENLQKKGQKDVLPAYLLLAPPEYIEQCACTLIKTKNDFDNFNWKQLTKLMEFRDPVSYQKMYFYLLKRVLVNLKAENFDDYVFLAETFRKVFNDDPQAKFLAQQYYIEAVLKSLFISQKKQCDNQDGTYDDTIHKALLKKFMGFHENFDNSNEMKRKQRQISDKLVTIYNFLDSNVMSIQKVNQQCQEQPQEYKRLMRLAYIQSFTKQLRQLSQSLQNENSYQGQSYNINYLRSFNPSWYYGRKQQQSKSNKVLILVKNLKQFDCVALYVYYIKALMRRNRIMYEEESNQKGLMNLSRECLGNMKRLESEYQSRIQQGLPNKENPIAHCREFKDLCTRLQQDIINQETLRISRMRMADGKKIYAPLNTSEFAEKNPSKFSIFGKGLLSNIF